MSLSPSAGGWAKEAKESVPSPGGRPPAAATSSAARTAGQYARVGETRLAPPWTYGSLEIAVPPAPGAARMVSLVVTAAGEAYYRHPNPRAGDPAARRDPRGGYTGSANLLVRYLNQGRAHDQRAAPPPNWMAG
jgi:hypothetical protein